MPDYNDPNEVSEAIERLIARARKQIAQGERSDNVLIALRSTLGCLRPDSPLAKYLRREVMAA